MIKGEMTISSFIFGLATALFVVCGVVLFSTDVILNNYPTSNTTNFTKITNLNGTMGQLSANVTYNIQQATETSGLESAGYAVKGGWNTMLLMFSSLDIFDSMMGGIGGTGGENEYILPFRLPDWFYALMIMLVTFVIVFGLLKYIGKVNI